jgi:1-acyl-sn-glycerol-3-phosphate acyltransferase
MTVRFASSDRPGRPGRPPGPLGATLRGVTAFTLLTLNTLVWCVLLFSLALLKLVLPPRLRPRLDPALNAVATGWVGGNSGWMRLTQRTRWDVQGHDGLDPAGWYLVCCNHQSWVDIFVLQHVLNRRVPLLKFFLKRELIYVPVMGLAWWALDFPFMRRHSAAALARRPELRQQDLQTTRRACARFAHVPTSVMNFVEGTRCTPAKQAAQGSPYRHLLVPRTGALAVTLDAMGPRFSALLDATIVYPGGVPSFWQFLCGRVPQIVVRLRTLPIPPELAAAAESAEARRELAGWIGRIWAEKDAQIAGLLETSADAAPAASVQRR